jgi:hypothetical protein
MFLTVTAIVKPALPFASRGYLTPNRYGYCRVGLANCDTHISQLCVFREWVSSTTTRVAHWPYSCLGLLRASMVTTVSQVTLNVAELLSWPVIDATSGTALGKLAQATPVAGSSAGTVNWMEVSDQAVTAIGAPLSSSWLLPC